MSLMLVQIKPNPLGKDKCRDVPKPRQLLGEWVDFKNISNGNYVLNDISISHLAFGRFGSIREIITGFNGSLESAGIIRLHSGKKADLNLMAAEDWGGANHHLFTERNNFIWNNAQGDQATLLKNDRAIDQASYEPYPIEGAILQRSGDKFVLSIRSASNYSF